MLLGKPDVILSKLADTLDNNNSIDGKITKSMPNLDQEAPSNHAKTPNIDPRTPESMTNSKYAKILIVVILLFCFEF